MWLPDGQVFSRIVGLLLLTATTLAASQDPAELERELEALRAQIGHIQERLDRDLEQRDSHLSDLAESERALAAAEQARRRTEQQMVQTRVGLDELQARIDQAEENRLALAEQLAAQLRVAYRHGMPSRLQLLLNQDDPRRLNRHLAYHAHLARTRLDLIEGLQTVAKALVRDRRQLAHDHERLEGLNQQQAVTIDRIERERAARDLALTRLEERISQRGARVEELRRDAADLEALIEELARALRDIPMDLEVPSIFDLKGELPLPLEGRVIRRYGDPRGGEVRWTGWLLEATAGAEVRAIAHGRVAYADWLRGYGMLTILEHGDGVMSLYGHNESLIHEVGAWVRPGEVIATAGSSGGADSDGLYFELRQDGQPVDPVDWLQRP